MANICLIFCEDYEGRCSGGPDLFVWNAKADKPENKCKFVEVKGPGDRPQENQKLWFDSLQRSGANIEICYVVDVNDPNPGKKRKRESSPTRRKGDPMKSEAPESEDENRLEYEDDANSNKKPRLPAPA